VLSVDQAVDMSEPDSSLDSGEDEQTRVLVVEDDEMLMKTLCMFARHEGYSAEGVTNGAAALQAVAIRRPDIVVLDLLLPVMDGYELMERLTAQLGRGRPRVIVLSATDRLDLAQARLGAEAYIAKPFDPERLRAALRRVAVPVGRRRT
jgi:CheY-like chemotaxis protein